MISLGRGSETGTRLAAILLPRRSGGEVGLSVLRGAPTPNSLAVLCRRLRPANAAQHPGV